MSEDRPRDPRPYIYAALCLGLAALYLFLFRAVIPSRHGSTQLMAYAMVAAMAAAAVALPLRRRWSWWVGVVACGTMVALCIALLVLILHSAAFLAGVYGAFGRGASSMAYLAAALIVQVVGLVPALLMKYLMTRSGRRWFGLEPLWRRA